MYGNSYTYELVSLKRLCSIYLNINEIFFLLLWSHAKSIKYLKRTFACGVLEFLKHWQWIKNNSYLQLKMWYTTCTYLSKNKTVNQDSKLLHMRWSSYYVIKFPRDGVQIIQMKDTFHSYFWGKKKSKQDF